MEGKDRREGKKIESKRKGLAETERGRQEGDMRGLASTRGFPNCAMSLSVIDRFASAINTGHQALATPYTSLSLAYSLPSTDHPRIYPLQRLSLSLFIPLHPSRLNDPPPHLSSLSPYVSLSLSFSLVISPLASLLPLSLSQRGTENLDLQKSVRGRTWRSSTLSRCSPSPSSFSRFSRLLLLLPTTAPSFLPPLSKLQRWPSSLSLISLLQRVKLHRCFFAIS